MENPLGGLLTSGYWSSDWYFWYFTSLIVGGSAVETTAPLVLYLLKMGGSLTGALTGTSVLFASLTVGGSAVAKTAPLVSYLLKTGGTLTGALTVTSGVFNSMSVKSEAVATTSQLNPAI